VGKNEEKLLTRS